NDVATIHGAITSDVTFTDANGFSIAADGLSASQRLILTSHGEIVRQDVGFVRADVMELYGEGSFDLSRAGNNINKVVVSTSNDVNNMQGGRFSVLQAAATGSGAVTLTSGNNLNVSGAVTARGQVD